MFVPVTTSPADDGHDPGPSQHRHDEDDGCQQPQHHQYEHHLDKLAALHVQELERKRARDRRSQQAMRDRTKWTIHSLSQQVADLSARLDQRGSDLGLLQGRVACLEADNAQLRTNNAALQLSLMSQRVGASRGDHDGAATAAAAQSSHSPRLAAPLGLVLAVPPRWEVFPLNSPPSCLADEILQGFVDGVRSGKTPRSFPLRPSLGSLLDDHHRSDDDDISNVVADVLRTYREIESKPKQVAVFYVLATLLKWMIMLDSQSWHLMPEWLHPVPAQLSTPHSAWIDRIPWPKARDYLITHPEITLDDFAAPYSSGFDVNWPYDPSLVLLATSANDGAPEITINPVYEEHICQIRHWTVGDAFRRRFPELSRLIDLDVGQGQVMSPRQSSSSISQGSPF